MGIWAGQISGIPSNGCSLTIYSSFIYERERQGGVEGKDLFSFKKYCTPLYVWNKGFTTCVYYRRFPEPENSLGGLLNLIKPLKIWIIK